jgi:hypothetical protein
MPARGRVNGYLRLFRLARIAHMRDVRVDRSRRPGAGVFGVVQLGQQQVRLWNMGFGVALVLVLATVLIFVVNIAVTRLGY